MEVTAYKNTSKFYSYRLQRDGEDLDLSAEGVTNIEVVDQGKSISVSSGNITFDGSVVNIQWGAIALPAGTYSPTLYIYSASNPEGEVLYGPLVNPITLILVEDERPQQVTVSATAEQLTLTGESKPIKSLLIGDDLIDFSLYDGDLSALSDYVLTLSGVNAKDAIGEVISLPSLETFSFTVLLPNGVSSSYKRQWLM